MPLLVVGGTGPSLLGRNWLHKLRLDRPNICHGKTLQAILQKHAAVFKEELGELRGTKAIMETVPEVQPHFNRPRPVPFAIKAKVEEELE